MSTLMEKEFRTISQTHKRHFIATSCCKAPVDFCIHQEFENCTWRCSTCGADRPEVEAGQGTQILCGKPEQKQLEQ